MKHKFFVLSAIALIAVVGLFVFEHATSAQRPDRNAQPEGGQRGNRPEGERGNRDMMARIGNPTSMVDNSWLDLTFSVKVDDETLVKARPIYQTTRDKFGMKMKELQASDDMRAAMTEMLAFTVTTGKEFQAGLKKVLTGEQLTKLNTLTKERQTAAQARRNRFSGQRGGQQGGQRGGQQGGQRPTQ